jgi:L-threonylcarbamoyladenylate synthase
MLQWRNQVHPGYAIFMQPTIIITQTDTIYGILAPAFDRFSVERIYDIKGRNETKPCIILLLSIQQLEQFGIHPNEQEKHILESLWGTPRPTSIILDIPESEKERLKYLHRGTGSLAFRLVTKPDTLVKLLQTYGPMIAPSANPEGKPPAQNLDQAKEYFQNEMGIIYKESPHSDIIEPSRIVRISRDTNLEIIRE